MSDELNKALHAAAEAFHKIGGAMYARRVNLEKLTAPLRASFEKKKLTDKEIEDLATDSFETIILALNTAGDPDVTVMECKKEDITP